MTTERTPLTTSSQERRGFISPLVLLGSLSLATAAVGVARDYYDDKPVLTVNCDDKNALNDTDTWEFPAGEFDRALTVRVSENEYSFHAKRADSAVVVGKVLLQPDTLEVVMKVGDAELVAGQPAYTGDFKPGDQAITAIC